MAATAVRPATHPAARAAGWPAGPYVFLRRGRAIALHVLDDNFLQPPAGTGAPITGQRARPARPARPRRVGVSPSARRPSRRAGARRSGLLGIAAGARGAPLHARASARPATTSPACSRSPPACSCSASAPSRCGGRGGPTATAPWRYARRALLGVAGCRGRPVVGVPDRARLRDDPHRARRRAGRTTLGVASEDVRFTTSDGLELEGWYVPSRNGAAVIAFPGRSGPQKQTRMLARHGYGVLLLRPSRRGPQRGRAERLGLGRRRGRQGRDRLPAAPARRRARPHRRDRPLGRRRDAARDRRATPTRSRRVVSEGAGARSITRGPGRGPARRPTGPRRARSARVKTAVVAVFAQPVPPPATSSSSSGRIAARPLLLIAAPQQRPRRGPQPRLPRAAGAELWEIPESGHVGGLEARPEEYERRVVGFFNAALR